MLFVFADFFKKSVFFLATVHRITFRLPSYQSRGFSKKRGDLCKKERDPPCDDANKKKLKPECERKKKIKCYCVKKELQVRRTPCELACEDEMPRECRMCKRFEVREEPPPKRKPAPGRFFFCLFLTVLF